MLFPVTRGYRTMECEFHRGMMAWHGIPRSVRGAIGDSFSNGLGKPCFVLA